MNWRRTAFLHCAPASSSASATRVRRSPRPWPAWSATASSTLQLPSAPAQFIQYLENDDRPQVAKDVGFENGMGISIGRLREDRVYDWKFVGLSHNTLRGAAGGGVEAAEYLCAKGYIEPKEA